MHDSRQLGDGNKDDANILICSLRTPCAPTKYGEQRDGRGDRGCRCKTASEAGATLAGDKHQRRIAVGLTMRSSLNVLQDLDPKCLNWPGQAIPDCLDPHCGANRLPDRRALGRVDDLLVNRGKHVGVLELRRKLGALRQRSAKPQGQLESIATGGTHRCVRRDLASPRCVQVICKLARELAAIRLLNGTIHALLP